MIKTLLPAVALTATAVVAVAPAHAGSTTYLGDFNPFTNLANSWSYTTTDGVDITATATSYKAANDTHYDSKVGKYIGGLGVTNTQVNQNLGSDSHEVDGRGWNDTVWLDFSTAYELEKVYFSYVDCNDDVRIVDENHQVLAQIDLGSQPNFFSIVGIDLSGLNISGTKLGFTAFGGNDDWKLKAIKGHAVPTPSAAAAGILGLAALSARRRRQQEAAAE